MARSRGIPGLGLAMATVGTFLIYVGIRNVPLLEGLREITSGRTPTPRPSKPTEVEFEIPGGEIGGGDSGSVMT